MEESNKLPLTTKMLETPLVIFHEDKEKKEILRFEKDQLFLYGEKVEIKDPEVIEGFRTWMKAKGYINTEK
jgi:hypothetical protein